MYACMYVFMYICMHVSVYVCMDGCMYVTRCLTHVCNRLLIECHTS